MAKKIIGLQKPPTGIGHAGIGYVVVPNADRRAQYIEDCYRTQTLTINGGWGYGFFPAVKCDRDVLQRVSFPVGSDEDNRGSTVVWVKDGISQRPVVVALLDNDSEFFEIEERTHRISRKDGKTVIDIFADAKNSAYQINVVGRDGAPAKLDIKVSSHDSAKAASAINISCDHAVNVSADDEINVLTAGSVTATVVKDGSVKGRLKYDHDNGLDIVVENRAHLAVTDEQGAVQMEATYSVRDVEAAPANDDHGEITAADAGLRYRDQFGHEVRTIEDIIEVTSAKLIQINGGTNGGAVNVAQIRSLVQALAKDLAVAQSGANLSSWMATELPKVEDTNFTH